jgi:hypothetical protein
VSPATWRLSQSAAAGAICEGSSSDPAIRSAMPAKFSERNASRPPHSGQNARETLAPESAFEA